jgi:hypothetical protein
VGELLLGVRLIRPRCSGYARPSATQEGGSETITSTIERVEPPRLFAWTGRTLGIKAIHVWWPASVATLRCDVKQGSVAMVTVVQANGVPG